MWLSDHSIGVGLMLNQWIDCSYEIMKHLHQRQVFSMLWLYNKRVWKTHKHLISMTQPCFLRFAFSLPRHNILWRKPLQAFVYLHLQVKWITKQSQQVRSIILTKASNKSCSLHHEPLVQIHYWDKSTTTWIPNRCKPGMKEENK